MSMNHTVNPDQRARLALSLIGDQAKALAEACLRVGEGTETREDRETITDALQRTLAHGGSRAGILCTQDTEENLAPVLMLWLFPECPKMQGRYQKYLADLRHQEELCAQNEGLVLH